MDEEQRIEIELQRIDEMRNKKAKKQAIAAQESKIRETQAFDTPIRYASQLASVQLSWPALDYQYFRTRVEQVENHEELVSLLAQFKQQSQQGQQAHDAAMSALQATIDAASGFVQQRAAMGRTLQAAAQLETNSLRLIEEAFNGKEQQHSTAIMLACNQIEQLDVQIAQVHSQNLDLEDEINIHSEQLVHLRKELALLEEDGQSRRVAALQDELRQLVEVRDQLAEELQELCE